MIARLNPLHRDGEATDLQLAPEQEGIVF